MRYWWVNQNQTFRQEIGGGYLWSPKRNANGARNPFYESMRDVAFSDVRAQATAARNQMLRAWRSLPEPSPEADRWISKSGPEHYAEHLPRLREWVAELRG